MPENPTNGAVRRRRYAPRSRVGCVTCRRRRKRCSGSKPLCDACQRLNLECVWSAKQHVPDPDAPDLKPLSPSESQSTRICHAIPSSPPYGATTLAPSPASLGQLTTDEVDQRVLMSYYISSFVPNISVFNDPANFLTSVYIPMAFHCDAVRHAVLACASAHLSQVVTDTNRQTRLLQQSWKYKRQAQQFLHERISTSRYLRQDSLECMAAMLMLVGLEVQNGTRTSTWLDHLDCVRNIIREHGGYVTFSSGSWEAGCLYQHFLYHNVMSVIISGVSRRPSDWDDDLAKDDDSSPPATLRGAEMPRGVLPLDDDTQTTTINSHLEGFTSVTSVVNTPHPLLGLSMTMNLFHIIQRMQLIRMIDDDSLDSSQHKLFLDLEHQIQTLRLDLPPDNEALHIKLDATARIDLITLAEINRLAALILLYRRSASRAPQLVGLAQQLLSLADRVPVGSSAEAGLTYPLFLAGAQLESQADIFRCGTRLSNIRQRVKVMNILSAEKVLEEVWREKLNGGVYSDWEDVLRKQQWLINLA